MAKSTNDFFFDNFIKCAGLASRAAVMLTQQLNHFNGEVSKEQVDSLHALEHEGDELKHEMMSELVKAFITPIERDDIIELSQTIDEVTDAIEDILIHMYITGTKKLRPDALEFTGLICQCCEAMKELLVEFKGFKKSKDLSRYIIEINRLEEEGDRIYIGAMRALHHEPNDVLEIIAWREIYSLFEKVCDACEDVADIVESIAIENI